MKTALVILVSSLLYCVTSCNEPIDKSNFEDDKFKVGQIWQYKTRQGEENSTLTILKVEKYDTAGVVVHICVNNLKVKNSEQPTGFSEEIGHLPMSKEALLNSVTSLVSENNDLPDYTEGYNLWKEAFDSNTGGVFSVSVSDAVKYTEEAINSGRREDY